MQNPSQKKSKKSLRSNKIKIIVFDFDGVIIDSLKIKREAYYKLFSSHKGLKNVIKNVLSQMTGQPRDKIIAAILNNSGLNSSNLDAFIRKYNEIVLVELIEMGIPKSVFRVLKNLSLRYSLYINSSTPHENLEKIINGLGINSFFKGTYGKTDDQIALRVSYKHENLNKIIDKEKVSAARLMFIGDHLEDYLVAKKAGCLFLAFNHEFSTWNEENIVIISALEEIPTALKDYE